MFCHVCACSAMCAHVQPGEGQQFARPAQPPTCHSSGKPASGAAAADHLPIMQATSTPGQDTRPAPHLHTEAVCHLPRRQLELALRPLHEQRIEKVLLGTRGGKGAVHTAVGMGECG